jgi:hypothetical protein
MLATTILVQIAMTFRVEASPKTLAPVLGQWYEAINVHEMVAAVDQSGT